MARITPIAAPEDHPGGAEAELAALFETLFPGEDKPRFDDAHTGLAIAAHHPGLALKLAQLSGFIAGELPWSGQKGLRELAIQTVNLAIGSAYSFAARRKTARACGLSDEQLDALASDPESALFDPDQRLVIAYARACATGSVTDALSARMVARFGEKGTVEATALIAFWGFWAMFLGATCG